MRTRKKIKHKVEVRPPSRHSKNVLEIGITNNGYQWSTIGLETQDQVRSLFHALGQYLDLTETKFVDPRQYDINLDWVKVKNTVKVRKKI